MCSAAAGSAAPVIEMVIINFGLGERPSAKYFSRRPSLLVRSFPTSIKSQSDHLGNFVCSSQQPNLGREPESPIELLLQIDWIFFVRMWAWVLWREMGAYYPILLSYISSLQKETGYFLLIVTEGNWSYEWQMISAYAKLDYYISWSCLFGHVLHWLSHHRNWVSGSIWVMILA